MGSYWDEVKANKPKTRHAWRMYQAEIAADRLNNALKAVLPAVQDEPTRLLAYFQDPWLALQIDFTGIRVDKASKGYLDQLLRLRVKFRGRDLDDSVTFLNEGQLQRFKFGLISCGCQFE